MTPRYLSGRFSRHAAIAAFPSRAKSSARELRKWPVSRVRAATGRPPGLPDSPAFHGTKPAVRSADTDCCCGAASACNTADILFAHYQAAATVEHELREGVSTEVQSTELNDITNLDLSLAKLLGPPHP